MLTLRKYFGTIRNSLYEEQLATDLGSIETAVNGIERDITNHKRADNAHTSSQVAHGGGLTVYEEIEIAKALYPKPCFTSRWYQYKGNARCSRR